MSEHGDLTLKGLLRDKQRPQQENYRLRQRVAELERSIDTLLKQGDVYRGFLQFYEHTLGAS